MNFFWSNVFEHFKDRRFAAVFFGTLAAFFGAMIVGAILYQVICAYELQGYLPDALPGGGVFLLVWVVLGIRRMRARRLDRYKSSPLSRDELSKARSKLKMKSTFKKS
jgi:purine-cytosine permease-like protein